MLQQQSNSVGNTEDLLGSCVRPSLRHFEDTEFLAHLCSLFDEIGIHYWLDQGTLLGVVRDGKLIESDHDLDVSSWSGFAEILAAKSRFEDTGVQVVPYPEQQAIHFFGQQNRYLDLTFYDNIDGNAVRYWSVARLGQVANVFRRLRGLLSVYSGNDDDWNRWMDDSRQRPRWKKLRCLFRWATAETLNCTRNACSKSLCDCLLSLVNRYLVLRLRVSVPSIHFADLAKVSFGGREYNIPAQCERYLELKYGSDWRTPRSQWIYWKDDKAIEKGSLVRIWRRFRPWAGQ